RPVGIHRETDPIRRHTALILGLDVTEHLEAIRDNFDMLVLDPKQGHRLNKLLSGREHKDEQIVGAWHLDKHGSLKSLCWQEVACDSDLHLPIRDPPWSLSHRRTSGPPAGPAILNPAAFLAALRRVNSPAGLLST